MRTWPYQNVDFLSYGFSPVLERDLDNADFHFSRNYVDGISLELLFYVDIGSIKVVIAGPTGIIASIYQDKFRGLEFSFRNKEKYFRAFLQNASENQEFRIYFDPHPRIVYTS